VAVVTIPPEATPAVVASPAPQATSTPEPNPPTATPTGLRLVLLTEGGARVESLQLVMQSAAQEFGWLYELVQGTDLALVEAVALRASIVVVDGPTLAEQARVVAQSFRTTTFINLSPSDQPLDSTNMLALTEAGAHTDQLGFLAGMAAGLATGNKHVAAITDLSVTGLNYRNGFLHGVRYTCPRCDVKYIDVTDPVNGGAAVSQQAALFASISSDVIFAVAGPAGNAGLLAAAQEGAWVIGAGEDVYATVFDNGTVAGADKVLTSVYWDMGAAVDAALAAYQRVTTQQAESFPLGTQAFSAYVGAVTLAPYRSAGLSGLDQKDIATALARLADGTLDTGVDPVTGLER
jgi:basic membrane lipoprotein Med (substrate-binding protein (PBP1-ABC) superfamily)